MKPIIQLLIVLIIATLINNPSMAANETLDDISQLKWKNRVLLIKPKMECDQEISVLMADDIEINDRDIIWFVFCDGEVVSNYPSLISDKFIVETIESLFARNDVTILLVGKDGGVKRRTDELNLVRLYQLIDSMPMRQDEMNLKN